MPDATPRRIAVRDAHGRVIGHVTGAGHGGPRETRDLAADFPPAAGQRPEVALLHARVVGSRDEESHEPYAPTTRSTLAQAGYHYWALGHVHVRQCLGDAPAIHYPGNLQGRTHAESGPKGGLLVDIDESGRAHAEFRAFAPVRWETVTVSGLEEVATFDGLVASVLRRWRAERADDPVSGDQWMVRVVLGGGTALHAELSLEENIAPLAAELAEAMDALEVEVWADAVHAVVDVAEHRDRPDVLGEALRRLAALERGGPLPDGLADELAGPEHGVGPIGPYVSGLLAGAQGELLSRMLDPERREP
jgi:DNA repair exonuclease SbcCD nuclease subunit